MATHGCPCGQQLEDPEGIFPDEMRVVTWPTAKVRGPREAGWRDFCGKPHRGRPLGLLGQSQTIARRSRAIAATKKWVPALSEEPKIGGSGPDGKSPGGILRGSLISTLLEVINLRLGPPMSPRTRAMEIST